MKVFLCVLDFSLTYKNVDYGFNKSLLFQSFMICDEFLIR